MKTYLVSLVLIMTANVALALEPLVPFELPWVNHETTGTVYRSVDHPNGIFILEAYFNGCPYCHQNAPAVEALVDEYAGESRVQVLDVGYDCSTREYTAWLRRHTPNHPVLNDCRGSNVLRRLGVRGYPSTVIIDCHGQERFRSTGVWTERKKDEMRLVIDTLLSESCVQELY